MNKKHLSLVLVLIFSLTLITSGCLDQVKDWSSEFGLNFGGGCSSPECAANSYVENVASGNYKEAVSYTVKSLDDEDDKDQAEEIENSVPGYLKDADSASMSVNKKTCVTSGQAGSFTFEQIEENIEDSISDVEVQEVCAVQGSIDVEGADDPSETSTFGVVKMDGSYYVFSG